MKKLLSVILLLSSFTGAYSQYTESFNTTSTPAGWTNTSSTANTSANALWKFTGNPGYAMSGTIDHSGNNGSFAWVDGSVPSGLITMLETPNIPVTGNLEVSFWLKSNIGTYNTTHNTFFVEINTGASWITVFTYSANTVAGAWENFIVDLGPYTPASIVKLRFNVNQNGSTAFYNDIALDDISIYATAPPAPNDIGIGGLIAPSNFCPGTEPVIVQVNNDGLNAVANYSIAWELNGISQSNISITSPLDTVNGVGANSANVTLGNVLFSAGQTTNIKAWTFNPNGVSDTSNFNDTLSIVLKPALSGVLTIGGTIPDYTTIGAALTDIDANGICGPVVFNVRSGIYAEQPEFNSVNGASSTNTITFQSDPTNLTKPVIEFAGTSTANYVAKIDGAEHLTIDGLAFVSTGTTYARVIDIKGTSQFVTLENDSLVSPNSTSTSNLRSVIYMNAGNAPSDITINNCFLRGGSTGAYFRGSSTTSRMENVTFTNNQVIDYYNYGVYYWYGSGSVFSNNVLRPTGAYNFPYGIYFYYQNNAPQIIGNDYQYDFTTAGYGLYTFYCEGNANKRALIANNFVHQLNTSATSTNYGIYVANPNKLDVYHNTVVHNSGSTFTRAFYLSSFGAYTDVNIMNNIFVTNSSTQAFYINSGGAAAITLMDYNNMKSNGNLGYYGTGVVANLAALKGASGMNQNSLSVTPNFISSTDLHLDLDLFLDKAAFPVNTVPTDIDGELRSLTNPDIGADESKGPPNNAGVASVSRPFNPLCGSGDNKVWATVINSGDSILDSVRVSWKVNRPGAGALPLVSTTIYPNLQAGASTGVLNLGTFQGGFQSNDTLVVYTSMPNGIIDSLSTDDTLRVNIINGHPGGTFTVGDTSTLATIQADFASFNHVSYFLDSIQGICDSLIFDVIDSTFNEQVIFNELLGTSAASPVIFRGLNGASSTARLSFKTVVGDTNYTMQLNEAKYFYFENLSIENTGSLINGGNYGLAVSVNQSENIYFNSCRLSGNATLNTASADAAIVKLGFSDGIYIDDCSFNRGSIGVVSLSSNFVSVSNSTFKNQYKIGFSADKGNYITVDKNTFNSNSGFLPAANSADYSAQISLANVTGNAVIKNNVIYGNDQFPLYGIVLQNCQATSTNRNLIINNFIGVGAAYSKEDFSGIYVVNSDKNIVANNNIAIEGNSNSNSAVLFEGGSSNELLNNNLVNFGNGYAININNYSSVISSNHNNLFSNGNNLVEYVGNKHSSVSSWTSVGFDLNSVSLDPMYHKKPSNLHVCNSDLDGLGSYLPFNTFDIDNDPKDLFTPDIGADEFTPVSEFSLGPDTGLCVGAVAILSGGSNTGDLNVWSTGDSSASITVSQAGQYVLTLFNECGIKQDTLMVSIQTPVDLPNDTNICLNQSITIDAGVSNATYDWSNGVTSKIIVIDVASTYNLLVTDQFGCQSADTMFVSQSGIATIQGDSVLCGLQTAFIEALPSNSDYTWSTGSSNNILSVTKPGIYSVVVNDKGCISSDTVIISQAQLSKAEYTSNLTPFTFEVTANNSIGDKHYWNFGDGNTSNLKFPTHLYSAGGNYIVNYIVSNNCDSSSSEESVEVTTNIENSADSKNDFVLYPNPNNGSFNLVLNNIENQNVEISVFDYKGAIVSNKNINTSSNQNSLTFDLNNISNGLYTIKIKHSKGVYTTKFNVIK